MKANPSVILPCLKYGFLAAVLVCTVTISLLNLQVSTLSHKFFSLALSTRSYVQCYQVTARNATSNTNARTSQTTALPGDISHRWNENGEKKFPIFVLSAIGSNTTTRHNALSEVKINGWLVNRRKKFPIKCCILLTSGIRYEFLHPDKETGRDYTKLTSTQIKCPVNAPLHDVRGVTIQQDGCECPVETTSYLKPYVPQKINKNHSFAICLKLLYGQVNNTLFKYWVEYNREIGIDKIIMFTHNISKSTTDLLKKYMEIGYIEKRPFEIPKIHEHKIGDKNAPYYEDERVIMFDCRQRLSGYKYMAVVDMDEFLVPRKHENVKEMMKYLMKETPEAAGFAIKSYLFLNSEEPGFDAPLKHSGYRRYFKRTGALDGKFSRQKNIILPSRIEISGYSAHRFEALQGYKKVDVNTSVATLNHYRSCYENLAANCSKPLTTDTFIFKFIERVRERTSYSDT